MKMIAADDVFGYACNEIYISIYCACAQNIEVIVIRLPTYETN